MDENTKADVAHEAWLAERRTGLGGSDIAAILGLSKWKTPLDVYLDKIGEGSEDPDDEKRRTFARGHAMEPTIVDEYARTLPEGVTIVEYPTVHNGCLLANVDRLIVAEDEHGAKHHAVAGKRIVGILECKTSRELTPWEEVPAYYQTQVLHYLGFFSKAQYVDVAVWFANDKFKVYRIERDDALIAEMRAYAVKWWHDHVVNRVPPPAKNLNDCNRLYPKSTPAKKAVANDELAQKVIELVEAKNAIKALEAKADKLQGDICVAMADAEVLTYDGATIATWKSAKPSARTDWKSLAAYLKPDAETIAKYTKTTEGTRRFLLK